MYALLLVLVSVPPSPLLCDQVVNATEAQGKMHDSYGCDSAKAALGEIDCWYWYNFPEGNFKVTTKAAGADMVCDVLPPVKK